jgi:hypothetical protein
MAQTIVRQLGGAKDTVTPNRKTICYSPKGERVQIKPGTVPKTKY